MKWTVHLRSDSENTDHAKKLIRRSILSEYAFFAKVKRSKSVWQILPPVVKVPLEQFLCSFQWVHRAGINYQLQLFHLFMITSRLSDSFSAILRPTWAQFRRFSAICGRFRPNFGRYFSAFWYKSEDYLTLIQIHWSYWYYRQTLELAECSISNI